MVEQRARHKATRMVECCQGYPDQGAIHLDMGNMAEQSTRCFGRPPKPEEIAPSEDYVPLLGNTGGEPFATNRVEQPDYSAISTQILS